MFVIEYLFYTSPDGIGIGIFLRALPFMFDIQAVTRLHISECFGGCPGSVIRDLVRRSDNELVFRRLSGETALN